MQRRLVILVLVLASLFSLGIGWRAENPVGDGKSTVSLATPVLSATRVPELLAGLTGDAKTRAVANQVSSNGSSCVAIYSEGRLVANKNASTGLIPASTLKLLTGFAALSSFGAEGVFTTSIAATNKPKNGTIEGSIYLVGGGDPLLFTSDYASSLTNRPDIHTPLELLADQLKDQGVKSITGSVIGDDHRFDNQRRVPSWDPTYSTQAMVSPIGALLVNQGFTKFNNPKMLAQDPALHAASVFSELLKQRGISIGSTSAIGYAPEKTQQLAKAQSRPLREIIAEMLTESDNTTAEMLLKNLGADGQEQGTTDRGVNVVRQKLVDQNIPVENLVMSDGSGLDRKNRASCSTIGSVLIKDGINGPLSEGLAKAGETGTLRDRMANTAAVTRVKAKTGTLNNVSSLAGWASSVGGIPQVFVVMSNGVDTDTARRVEDNLALNLATLPPLPSAIAYAPDQVDR